MKGRVTKKRRGRRKKEKRRRRIKRRRRRRRRSKRRKRRPDIVSEARMRSGAMTLTMTKAKYSEPYLRRTST